MNTNNRGFTILEMMLVVAIIGTLAAIAVLGYQAYTVRAKAADVLVRYDEMRTRTVVRLISGSVPSCDQLGVALNREAPVSSPYVGLGYAFQSVQGGYQPVLTVCGQVDPAKPQAVQVAQSAHDTLAKNANTVTPGAVLSDAVVSFSLRLVEGDRAVCTLAPSVPAQACTPAVAQQAASGTQTAAVPAGASAQAASTCPAGQTLSLSGQCIAPSAPGTLVVPPALPKVDAQVMRFAGTQPFARPAGGVLNTGGDLTAFTLDMTFIGDGSVAASSGGVGPVMFNYGSSADSHNAITLWNPRSLTVALQGQDLNTGINLIDGRTHRTAVSWDSATGTVNVYDNGQLVKVFSGVGIGQIIKGGGSMVVAHKDNGGNNYSPNEAFAGQVFQVSLANKVLAGADMVRPINQGLDASTGLLIDLAARGGVLMDTTGRHQIESGGMTVITTGVEGNLVAKP